MSVTVARAAFNVFADHLHHLLTALQIIAKVQSQGSAGLVVPPAEELPGGPFAAYPQFVTLMKVSPLAPLDSPPHWWRLGGRAVCGGCAGRSSAAGP